MLPWCLGANSYMSGKLRIEVLQRVAIHFGGRQTYAPPVPVMQIYWSGELRNEVLQRVALHFGARQTLLPRYERSLFSPLYSLLSALCSLLSALLLSALCS